MNIKSVGVIIPTYQAQKHLPHCIPPLVHSLQLLPVEMRSHARLLVIDSSSTDDTVASAKAMGAEVLVIPKEEFSHGATREQARKHLGTDIVVMLTQDSYANEKTLGALIKPLLEGKASVSYARQIPHDCAGYLESFSRRFNYPEESHYRTLADSAHYGVYTFFCSNSCAAYLNSALDEVGGFPQVSFGEDTLVVAKLLHRNHVIAYVAEAIVKHSHSYSLRQEFQRHYEIGFTRACYREWLKCPSSDEKRGRRYALELITEVLIQKPYLLPYTCCHIAAKWLGYFFGKMRHRIEEGTRVHV